MATPLDLLIAAAKAKVQTADAAKAATAGAKTAKTAAARAESLAESIRLQRELDWIPKALVLVIEEWTCTCESEGSTPMGMFVYKEHARMANSSILVAPRNEADEGNNLPRRIKFTERLVPICAYCCGDHQFDLELENTKTKFGPAVPQAPGPFVQDWLDKRIPEPEYDAEPPVIDDEEENDDNADD